MRIIIECPENILHLEAGYIYADCLFDSSTLLQSGGGPYIFANNEYDNVSGAGRRLRRVAVLNAICGANQRKFLSLRSLLRARKAFFIAFISAGVPGRSPHSAYRCSMITAARPTLPTSFLESTSWRAVS